MKSKPEISYEEYQRRVNHIKHLEESGFVIYPKKKLKVIGWIFIGFGVATIPIPGTTVPLIAVGLSFLGMSKYQLQELLRNKRAIMRLKLKSNA
jgi:hypothetical protein